MQLNLDLGYPATSQLSGYLYYLATILTYIMSIFNSLPLKILHRTVIQFMFYFILYQFYIGDNLLESKYIIICIYPTELAV